MRLAARLAVQLAVPAVRLQHVRRLRRATRSEWRGGKTGTASATGTYEGGVLTTRFPYYYTYWQPTYEVRCSRSHCHSSRVV